LEAWQQLRFDELRGIQEDRRGADTLRGEDRARGGSSDSCEEKKEGKSSGGGELNS